MFWPTPYPMITTLHLGGDRPSVISLPVIPVADEAEQRAAAAFAGSDNLSSRPDDIRDRRDAGRLKNWIGPVSLQRNETIGQSIMQYSITYREAYGTDSIRVKYTVLDDHPAGATVEASEKIERQIRGKTAVWTGETRITGDSTHFHYTHTRTLSYGGERIRQKQWKEKIRRDFQ